MDLGARFSELLNLEADAIKRSALVFDRDSIALAVDLLLECKSKIVLFGVGKSGLIAKKIAETMKSTGTVAIFVHPNDALHGSLGAITPDDVIIALSNSGETDELLALLPTLKTRGVKIIAMVGNVNSTLARESDCVIDASVDQEACSLNLAPTASTTVALALGDALAIVLMEKKGLTAVDFAQNHPAGRLGKRLTIRVRDLMHESPNISPESTLIDVVRSISKFSLGAVNVTDEDGSLKGIITDGDLRRAIELNVDFNGLTASEFMTVSPITVAPETLAFDALKIMEDRPSQISVLPVVENGKSVGLLRLHDIVRSGL